MNLIRKFVLAILVFTFPLANTSQALANKLLNENRTRQEIFSVDLGRHVPDLPLFHHQDPLHKFNTQAINPGVLVGCPSYTFWAKVSIGGENFRLIVDTGSTTLGVVGAGCTACGRSPAYFPSSTSQNAGFSVSASYGDGSGWSGSVYTDLVQLQGSSLSASMKFVSILTNYGTQGQTFFSSPGTCPAAPSSNSYQGIIGFAFPRLALFDSATNSATDSFFNKLVNQNINSMTNIFTLQLCYNTGKLWLGGYDSSYFTGALQYVQVTEQLWWVVQITGLSASVSSGVQSVTIPPCVDPNNACAIVDSGTTNIVLPGLLYDSLTNLISSDSTFSSNFPSNFFLSSSYVRVSSSQVTTLKSTLPSITFSFLSDSGGTTKLTLNAISSYLRYDPVQGVIYSGLQRSSQNKTILGWGFMNQFVSVHDLSNTVPRIGFAPTTYCDTLAPPATISYVWETSDYSICDCTGTHTQSRTVRCIDSAGNSASNSLCPSPVPATSQSCTSPCAGSSILGPTDPCANIICGHGFCQSGKCTCYGGYGYGMGQNCSVPPSVSLNSVNSDSNQINISYTVAGSPTNLNIFIGQPGFTTSFPVYVTRINSGAIVSGSYVASLPLLMGGNVQIGISTNSTLSSLSKTLSIPDPCTSISCGQYGTCFNGRCNCALGYTGSSCNLATCPTCSGQGSCMNGLCVCNAGYSGPSCNVVTCATSGFANPPSCNIPTSIIRYRFINLNVNMFNLPLVSTIAPSLAYLTFVNTLNTDLLTILPASSSSSTPAVVNSVTTGDLANSLFVDILITSPSNSLSDLQTLESTLNTYVLGSGTDITSSSPSTNTKFSSGLAGGHVDSTYIQVAQVSSIPNYLSVQWIENNWYIVAIGGGVFLLLICFLYCCCCRESKKSRSQAKQNKYADGQHPNQRGQGVSMSVRPNSHSQGGGGGGGGGAVRGGADNGNLNGNSIRYSNNLSPANVRQPNQSVSIGQNNNLAPPAYEAGQARNPSFNSQNFVNFHKPSVSEESLPGEGASAGIHSIKASPAPAPSAPVALAGSVGSSPQVGGWGVHADANGNTYWFNTATGESSWTKPPHVQI